MIQGLVGIALCNAFWHLYVLLSAGEMVLHIEAAGVFGFERYANMYKICLPGGVKYRHLRLTSHLYK